MKGCLRFSLAVLALSVLVWAVTWTSLIETLPVFLVLLPAWLAMAAVVWSLLSTRGQRFRVPWWAVALWIALAIVVVGLFIFQYNDDLVGGSQRFKLVSLAPRMASAATWFSFSAVLWTWAALRSGRDNGGV